MSTESEKPEEQKPSNEPTTSKMLLGDVVNGMGQNGSTPFDSLIPKKIPKVVDILGDTDITVDDPMLTGPQASSDAALPEREVSRIPAPPEGAAAKPVRPAATSSPKAPDGRRNSKGSAQSQPLNLSDMAAKDAVYREGTHIPLLSLLEPRHNVMPQEAMQQPQPMQPGEVVLQQQNGADQGFGISGGARRMSRGTLLRIALLGAIVLVVVFCVLAYALRPEWFTRDAGSADTLVNTNAATQQQVPQPTPASALTNAAAKVKEQAVADSDGDGLTDEQEITQRIDPKKIDTDADGLSDRQEIAVYKSNPNKVDTDGDGFSDGDEVRNFFNPIGPGALITVPEEIQKQQNSNQ